MNSSTIFLSSSVTFLIPLSNLKWSSRLKIGSKILEVRSLCGLYSTFRTQNTPHKKVRNIGIITVMSINIFFFFFFFFVLLLFLFMLEKKSVNSERGGGESDKRMCMCWAPKERHRNKKNKTHTSWWIAVCKKKSRKMDPHKKNRGVRYFFLKTRKKYVYCLSEISPGTRRRVSQRKCTTRAKKSRI